MMPLCAEAGAYGKLLHLPLNFVVNLKKFKRKYWVIGWQVIFIFFFTFYSLPTSILCKEYVLVIDVGKKNLTKNKNKV